LAEDHTIVREGLRALLKLESDIQVVAEAQDGRQAVVLAEKLKPDVIVMDIAMPLLNGMEATRQILHARPDVKVLVLSAHSDDAYVRRVMELGLPAISSSKPPRTCCRKLSGVSTKGRSASARASPGGARNKRSRPVPEATCPRKSGADQFA